MSYSGALTNLEIREYLNAALIALNFVIMVMIAKQLLGVFAEHRWQWRHRPGAISACAFWWVFFADFVRACLAWYLIHKQNAGVRIDYLGSELTMAYTAAAIIGTCATLRLVYALSPDHWGHKGWLAALVLTVTTVLALGVVA